MNAIAAPLRGPRYGMDDARGLRLYSAGGSPSFRARPRAMMHRLISHSLFGLAFALAMLPTTAGVVDAGTTDPVLALGYARADRVGTGAVLQATAIFGFDDLVQVSYPLTLVVYQGTTFTRFTANAPVQSGTFAGLADGLGSSELSALEAAGAAEPDAQWLGFEPNRLSVSLPSQFTDGQISVVLYIRLPGEDPVVSNTLTASLVTLPGS